MAHGQRQSRKSNHAGHDYWKPQGIDGKVKCWKGSVSHRAGTNKKTKRIVNKCKRKQDIRIIKEQIEIA